MNTGQVILVPVFPGTNCENETLSWIADNLNVNVQFFKLPRDSFVESHDVAAVVIPGGFSYGDYLRAGAIASRSLEMQAIKKYSQHGVPILGICNGFQILCESGLLPGVLVRNKTRFHFHSPVELTAEWQSETSDRQHPVWLPKDNPKIHTSLKKMMTHYVLPMSCGMGCYIKSGNENNYSVIFRYVHNEVFSSDAIAGIANAPGNVVGLMPHPERASDPALGGTQGLLFLYGLARNKNIGIRAHSPLQQFVQTHFGEDAFL